jgi:hypothetical protein
MALQGAVGWQPEMLATPRPPQADPLTGAPHRRVPPEAIAAVTAGTIAFVYAWSVLRAAAGYQASADSHYHFTVARSMVTEGLTPSPSAGLPWTVLVDLPVDHYWGFHLLLLPFALIGDYELGLRLATSTLFAAVFAAFGAYLARRGVRYPVAWALLAALFSNQDWRYLQLRGGQLLFPLSLLVVELVAFRRPSMPRNLLLVASAWFAMLGYHGAVLLLPFAVTAAAAAHLGDGSLQGIGRRLWWVLRDAMLTGAGLFLGLAANPYADRHASTFRFFLYHLWNMGRDSANLYADQSVAEFHGMPVHLLVWLPEWGLLLLATLGALLWLTSRYMLRRPPTRVVAVQAALALLGLLLMTQALRTREYAVPFAVALFATLWGAPSADRRWFVPVPLLLACAALWLKVPVTAHLLRLHLPTALFRGARPVLERNGEQPILNLAEADFGMLRIEYPPVVCVHALSRYFLYPRRELFDDLWYLHRSAGDSDARTQSTLRRFHDRGVRLVATHGNRPLDQWALGHQQWLRPVFDSPVSAARLYQLTVPANP